MAIKVIDGDTVEINGVSVRISGIDTRETKDNQQLRRTHSQGQVAEAYLEQNIADVVLGKSSDKYGRNVGRVVDSHGDDLSKRMVRQGLAAPTDASTSYEYGQFLAHGPNDEDTAENARLVALGRATAGDNRDLSSLPVFGREDKRSTSSRAFDRGTENLKASFYTFADVIAGAAGNEVAADDMARKAMFHMQKAGLIPADMASLRDVKEAGWAPEAVLTYAYERLIEEAPSLAVDAAFTLTGVGAGAAITRRAATTALTKKFGAEAMERMGAQYVAGQAAKMGAKKGAATGFVASTYPQSVAQAEQELIANDIEGNDFATLGLGAAIAGVQIAPELLIASKLIAKAGKGSDLATVKGLTKETAKNTGTGIVTEGGAEIGATVLAKAGVKAYNGAYEVFSDDNLWDMAEAGVAGSTVGGTLAGGGTVLAGAYSKADEIYQNKVAKIKAEAAERLAAEEAQKLADEKGSGLPQVGDNPHEQAFREAMNRSAEQQTDNEQPATIEQPPVIEAQAENEQSDVVEQTPPPASTGELESIIANEVLTGEQTTEVPTVAPSEDLESFIANKTLADARPAETQTAEQFVAKAVTSKTRTDRDYKGTPTRKYGPGLIGAADIYRKTGLDAYRQLSAHLTDAGITVPTDFDPFSEDFSRLIEDMGAQAKAHAVSKPKEGSARMTIPQINKLLKESAIRPLKQGRELTALVDTIAKWIGRPKTPADVINLYRGLRKTMHGLPEDAQAGMQELSKRISQNVKLSDVQMGTLEAIANGLFITTGDMKLSGKEARRAKPVPVESIVASREKATKESVSAAPVPTTQKRSEGKVVNDRAVKAEEKRSERITKLFDAENKQPLTEIAETILDIRDVTDTVTELDGNGDAVAVTRTRKRLNKTSSIEQVVLAMAEIDRETGEEKSLGDISVESADGENREVTGGLAQYQKNTLTRERKDAEKEKRAALNQRIDERLEAGEISADTLAWVDEYLKALGWNKSRIAAANVVTKIAAVAKRVASDYDQYVARGRDDADTRTLTTSTYAAAHIIRWYADMFNGGRTSSVLMPFAKALTERIKFVFKRDGVDIPDNHPINDLMVKASQAGDPNAEVGSEERNPFGKFISMVGRDLRPGQKAVINGIDLPTQQQLLEVPGVKQALNDADFTGLINALIDNEIIPLDNRSARHLQASIDFNEVSHASTAFGHVYGIGGNLHPFADVHTPDAGDITVIAADGTRTGIDNVGRKRPVFTPPAGETIPISVSNNAKTVKGSFHLAGYVSATLNGTDISANPHGAIFDTVNDVLTTLLNADPRFAGGNIEMDMRIPDDVIVFREELDSQKMRSYTWGEVKRIAAERSNSASAYISETNGEHRLNLQNEKVTSIIELEKMMASLFTNLAGPDGLNKAGREVARRLGGTAKQAQNTKNILRLIANMRLVAYGRDNKHFDLRDELATADEQELRKSELLMAFTEDDAVELEGFDAFVAAVEADRQRLADDNKAAKAAGIEKTDSSDWSKSTEYVNVDLLREVVEIAKLSGVDVGFTIDDFTSAFERLTDARSQLSEMDFNGDWSSAFNDLFAMTDIETYEEGRDNDRNLEGIRRAQVDTAFKRIKLAANTGLSPKFKQKLANTQGEIRGSALGLVSKIRRLLDAYRNATTPDNVTELAKRADAEIHALIDAFKAGLPTSTAMEAQTELVKRSVSWAEIMRKDALADIEKHARDSGTAPVIRTEAEQNAFEDGLVQKVKDKGAEKRPKFVGPPEVVSKEQPATPYPKKTNSYGKSAAERGRIELGVARAQAKKFEAEIEAMKKAANPQEGIRIAARMMLTTFINGGDSLSFDITYDTERAVGIYPDLESYDRYTINLSPVDSSPESMSRAMIELAHELAHLVADPFSPLMSDTDSKALVAEYGQHLQDNPGSYDSLTEYFADRVATRILQVTQPAVTALNQKYSGERKHNSPLAAAIAEHIRGGFAKLKHILTKLFPNRNFGRLEPDMLRVVNNALSRRPFLASDEFFNGRPKNALPTLKKAVKATLDNKMANFFKPIGRRLQNVHRELGRMFYTPSGEKRAGKTAGLMDESTHRRKTFVNRVNSLYAKHKEFKADYDAYLNTGKASARLTLAFKYMADALADVRGKYPFTGVPVMFSDNDIATRGAEFRQILLGSQPTAERIAKVDEFIKGFDYSNRTYSELDIKPSNPFGKAEVFRKLMGDNPQLIADLRRAGFIPPADVATLNQFAGGMAMRVEFERLFGGVDKDENGREYWNPSKGLTDRLKTIPEPRKREEAVRAIHSMLGFDAQRVHPAWRKTSNWAVSLTSLAILPYSGFASIPDLIMPFVRNRTWSGAFTGMMRTLSMFATNPARARSIMRAYSLASNSIHDTVWGQLAADNAFLSKTPGVVSTVLFKLNGLDLITKTSRNLAAVLAVDTITRHASNNSAESRRFLDELGITREQALALKAFMQKNDAVPMHHPDAPPEQNALADAISRAVTVFTNESLIHPNRGQVPAVMNDPNYRIFTMLKPFLYGFGAVVYGGGYREMRSRFMNHSDLGTALLSTPMAMAPMVLAFGLMMPLAAAGLELREWLRDMLAGNDTYSNRLNALSDKDYTAKIFARAGGAAFFEIPMQVYDGYEKWGGGALRAGLMAAGPVATTSEQLGRDIYKGRDEIRFGVWSIPTPD